MGDVRVRRPLRASKPYFESTVLLNAPASATGSSSSSSKGPTSDSDLACGLAGGGRRGGGMGGIASLVGPRDAPAMAEGPSPDTSAKRPGSVASPGASSGTSPVAAVGAPGSVATTVGPDAGTVAAGVMLSDEERERIRHEALLRAEIRRELEAAMAKPAKRPGLFARISSKVAPTTLLAIFGTLITLLVGFYHDYATSKQHEAKQSADIRKANRDKGMTLLSTFPNEMETSHAILAAMVQKRLWLASHRSDTDTDELGRSRKQVEEEFSEVWRMYAEARKPYAILTEVKVFFDSPTVIAAADAANAAIAKEYGAKTEDELDTEVHEAEGLIERLTDAMSDELNEVMTRPKRVHGAGAGGAASAPDPALRSPRDVTLGDARAPVDP